MLPVMHTPVARLAPSRRAAAEACYANAYHALSEGNTGQATRLFAILALLEPKAERCWVGLGACQERAGRLQAAATLYSVGAGLTGQRSAWLALGHARTMRALGHGTESQAAFDQAERLTDDTLLLKAIEEERCAL